MPEGTKDFGECPIHHFKYTATRICPGCLNDEFEKEEEKTREELEESKLYEQQKLNEEVYQ